MNPDSAPTTPQDAPNQGSREPVADRLDRAHGRFIERWADMAASWGVPRSMAEVHALLFIDGGSFNTDQLMARLGISRGNASMTTRTLVEWGLIERTHNAADRRDYFRAEQDVWKLFATVIRARKRREIDPLVGLVEECRSIAGPCECDGPDAERARSTERKLADIMQFVRAFDLLATRHLAGEGLGDLMRGIEGVP